MKFFLALLLVFASCIAEQSNTGKLTLSDRFESYAAPIFGNYATEFPEPFFDEERLYIDENELQISNEGIFVYLDEVPYRISTLHSDHSGIYTFPSQLITIFDKCRNGHTVLCPSCEGCGKALCPFRCCCRPTFDRQK